jgi:glyceraldehyde 3-phosphate dehydrogenase
MENTVLVGVNGAGRIGKLVICDLLLAGVKIVGINDLASVDNIRYGFLHDTVHQELLDKTFGFDHHDFQQTNDAVKVIEADKVTDGSNGHIIFTKYGLEIPVFCQKDASMIPWKKLGARLVCECTGVYASTEKAQAHITAGAEMVVINSPSKDPMPTVVYGVNQGVITKDTKFVSGASCTTNCIAPVLSVIEKNWEIHKGYMLTVHAYTPSQSLVDSIMSKKDLRGGRAAAMNSVPNSTGAAKAIGLVIPSLQGKIDGMAMRVPVVDGSNTMLYLDIKGTPTKDEINNMMLLASKNELKGVLGYTDQQLVSTDILGMTCGSMFDSLLTKVYPNPDDPTMSSVVLYSWYDNECSYTAQYVRLVKHCLGLLAK